MGYFRELKSDFSQRFQIVANRSQAGEKRVFACLELICFPVSLLTLAVLLPLQIASSHLHWGMPGILFNTINVLLSAAIGYITNYIAIEMLFKPYFKSKTSFFSIITGGYWQQGLIPKNKNNIGEALGQQIETRLLNPEQLANELCGMVMEFIGNPEIISRMKSSLQGILRTYEPNIIDFLMVQIENAATKFAEEQLTPEKIVVFWKTELEPVVLKEENRQLISKRIISGFQRRTPQLTDMLKKELVEICSDFFKNKVAPYFPFLLGLLLRENADPLAEKLASCINWDDIEQRMCTKIGSDATKQALQEELQSLLEELDGWIKSPEAQEKLNIFTTQLKEKIRTLLRKYIQTAIPTMIDNLVNSEKLWTWFEKVALPSLQQRIEALIKEQGKGEIIKKLDLANRISGAVEKQDVKEFHNMINSIAAQHLGAIQVLGYFLGLVIGLVQLLH